MAERKKDNVLRSYRVLDLAEEMGVYCGKVFGDFGADVIKVEPPGGASCRRIGPFYHDTLDANKSLFFWAFNTSKRGITLDITKADGKEIFKELVKQADVVVETFPPGYMDKLGLGYEVLSQINPGLVMTAVTPFGQSGPYKDYKGCDLIAQAGAHIWFAGDHDRPPVRPTFESAHPQAGILAAVGTLAALYYRDTTGEGQYVDVSVLEAILPYSFTQEQVYDYNREITMRHGDQRAPTPHEPAGPHRTLPCKDGYITGSWGGGAPMYRWMEWMAEEGFDLSPIKDKPWGNLERKMTDIQLRTNPMSNEDSHLCASLVTQFLKNKTKAEVQLEAAKREIQWFPVSTTADMMTDPQFVARGYWVKVDHPELGESITYPNVPVIFHETPGRISRRAPFIGEHNEEIYVKELGFSKEKLVMLKNLGVI